MKGNLTKERIIRQALTLFNRFGIKGTSISDLMAATDLEKGGIYRHFANKEEILEHSIRHYISLIEERLSIALDGITSPYKRLCKIIHTFVSIADHPVTPGGCFIMNIAVDTDFDGTGPHPLVVASFKRWERLFVREIQRGIEIGEFRGEFDAKDFAALAICSIEGSIVLAGVYPRMQSQHIISHHLTHHIESYLL